jgi:hypothetical protein
MSELDNPTEENDPDEFSAAFNATAASLNNIPDGACIFLSTASGQPISVPLMEGENGLVLRDAIERAGLTMGVVQFYHEQNPITLDTFVPANATVTVLGNVKGGM